MSDSISTSNAMNAVLASVQANIPGASNSPSESASPAVADAAQAPVTPATTQEAPAAPSAEEQKMAQRFAALSRREKEIQQREKAMNDRIKALEAESAEVAKYKDMPNRLKKAPLEVFKEAGLSIEEFTEMLMNDGNPTEKMQLNERDKVLMDKIEALQKKIEEKEQNEQKAKESEAIGAFKSSIAEHIQNNAEYELLRVHDPKGESVYEVIDRIFSETGEIPDLKAVTDAMENELLEEARKYVSVNKLKSLLPSQEAPKAPESSIANAITQRQSSPTLSNTASQTVPQQEKRPLSEEDRKKEIAKMLKWIS